MLETLNQALLVFLPVAYGGTVTWYWLSVRGPDLIPRWRPQAWLVATVVLHAILLVVRTSLLGQLPWTTYYDTLLALSFLMSLTYLLVEFSAREASTGMDLLPWPFVMVLYAAMFGHVEPKPNPALDSPFFAMHTIPAIGGIAAILVSGIYGGMYLKLERVIRGKRFGQFFERMPTLDVLSRMNFVAAATGLTLVTAAIGWGATWYGEMFQQVNIFEPKIFLTLICWTVLLVLVIGRLSRRWPDRLTALLSVAVATIALISIVIPAFPFIAFHGHY